MRNAAGCNRSDMPSTHGNAGFPVNILNFHHKD
jgi:hypothetical protein